MVCRWEIINFHIIYINTTVNHMYTAVLETDEGLWQNATKKNEIAP